MSVFSQVIMSSIEVLLVIYVASKFLEKKSNLARQATLMLILIVAVALVTLGIDTKYGMIVNGILIALAIKLMFAIKFREAIYTYLISLVILVISQIISFVPLLFIFGDIEKNIYFALLSQVLTATILVITVRFAPIKYFRYFIDNKLKIFDYTFVAIILSTLVLMLMWHSNLNMFLDHFIIIVIISVVVSMAILLILNNGLKNQKLENELEINKKYLPIVDKLMTNIRMRQHEHHNHLQALQMIVHASDDVEAIRYEVDTYLKDFKIGLEIDVFTKLNNKIVAGFLYAKMMKAKEKKVSMNVDIKCFSLPGHISNYDLIEVMGILLDNAIEATSENHKIFVELDEEKEGMIFTVKNQAAYINQETLGLYFQPGVTNKSGDRGYGLAQLKEIVSKLKGEIEFHNEKRPENFVVFKVFIP